jgi:hypothetical protein
MEKKLVLEELYRMRELMGMKVLSETRRSISHNLLMEAGKTVDEIIGLGQKSVDNLTKNGVDFVNDLTKLSDEFASRGIKTFADLEKAAAEKAGIEISDISDDVIESYIKNDEKLYQSILAKASAAASKQVDQLIKSANLSIIFSKNPSQLNSYKAFISTPPSARNVDLLINSVDESIDELEGIIDDVQTGKIAGVDTVPDELQELYENLLAKKTDLDNFKNKGTSTTPPKTSETTEIPKTGDPKIDGFTKKSQVDSLVDDMSDEDIRKLAEKLDDAVNNGPRYKSGYLSMNFDPEAITKVMEGIRLIVEKTFGIILAPGTGILKALGSVPKGSSGKLLGLVLTGCLIYGGVKFFNWLFNDAGEDIKKKADDLITPDSDEVNCVQSITNYNNLTEDQKLYVASRVGQQCSTTPAKKATAFANVNGELQIRYDDGCVEKINVDAGGLSGTVNGTDCLSGGGGGSTTSCTKTEQNFFDALDGAFGNHDGASWDASTCTGTYSGSTYDENDF